jgi:hypothetical protein
MRLSSWLRPWGAGRAPRGPAERRPAAPRFRPRAETLEDRWLPSQVNLTVSSLADSGPGTLRAAILAADMGGPSDKFTIGFSVSGTIDLQSPLPDLDNSIAIQGPGGSSPTVELDAASPFTAAIVTVDAGQTASLSGLTIAGGDAGGITNEGTLTVANSAVINCSVAPPGPFGISFGGGIENLGGTLTVSGCTLSGDTATFGGGIDNQGTATVTATTLSGNSAARGGGIRNSGTLTVSACTLSDNNGEGGGIYNQGTAAVTGSTFTGNTAFPGGDGGGIANFGGGLTVADSTFSGNSAPDETLSNGFVQIFGEGGAIFTSGTATVTDCTLSCNSAGFGGGIAAGGTLVVRGSTLWGNAAVDSGGGLFSAFGGTATVKQSTLSGNTAGFAGGGRFFNSGGAIANEDSALTVQQSTLSGNDAAADGGGIFNTGGTVTVQGSTLSGNSAAEGGAIYNDTAGTVTVQGGTLTGNTATDSGGGLSNAGTATVQESTLSGNAAGSDGGGIFNGASGTLAVKDGTVLGNAAPGGADLYTLGSLALDDSTVGVLGP